MNLDISIHIKTLPEVAGVYQFFNSEKKLLYVGKAKNLKKRVKSYFGRAYTNKRLNILVSKITSIEHIVVKSESDALLLENVLIKKYQPRYNILLKDDKSYPWICIKKESFPRIFYTRKLIKDGSEYFGPFTCTRTVKVLLDLIRDLYPLRTCNYDLSDKKITSGKYKVCLEYHLERCMAPCVNKINSLSYEKNIDRIRNIIQGNFKRSLDHFKKEMEFLAKKMEFEKAQKIKEKINILQNYQSKSTIVNPKINNVDVFSIISNETHAYVNFLQVSYGSVSRSHSLEIEKKLNEKDTSILQLYIVEIRQRFRSNCKEVYLPFDLYLGADIKVIVPKLGDKKRLVELSLKNAKAYQIERLKQEKIVFPEKFKNRVLLQMQKDLRLSNLPLHIECFDNSNIQGSYPVGACVVFKNGEASKKEYRHYHIKTVVGADDFSSMREVVFRRYSRLLEEKQDLPQLIIVDGGKGQLSSAIKALEDLQLRGKIAILGIAKRLEKLYFPNDPIPLFLDKKSETLKIIQRLRNEAHRFGINFHRQQRSKGSINSVLDNIKGVGEKTKIMLLKKFKSVKRIKLLSETELSDEIGKHKGRLIFDYLKKKYHKN